MAGAIKKVVDYDEIIDFDPEDSLLVWVNAAEATRRIKRKNLFANGDAQTVGGALAVTGNTTVGGTLGVSGVATLGGLTVNNAALTVKSGEGISSSIYLFADEGDDDTDKWRIIASTTSHFAIQPSAAGTWPSALLIHPVTQQVVLGGALSVAGASTLTGNTTIGGTLGVTGVSTFTGGFGNWTALTPATGFTNRGSNYVALSYRKVGDLVYVRGDLTATSDDVTAFGTLPAGFRPATHHTFLGVRRSIGHVYQSVTVYNNGIIELAAGQTPLETGEGISLNGIIFATN